MKKKTYHYSQEILLPTQNAKGMYINIMNTNANILPSC